MNSVIDVALPMLAFSGALMFLLPHISPRRYFFAITVAPDFPSSEAGRAVLRQYHLMVLAVVLLAAGAVWVLADELASGTEFAAMLAPMVAGVATFLWARGKVEPYSVSGEAVREATLSTEPDRLPRWIALALPPFAAPLVSAIYLRAHWDEIPQRFPVHFDLAGNPNRWAEKSAHGVYGPLLAEAGMMLLVLLISIATFYGARRGAQRAAVLKIIVVAMYFMAYIFTLVSLMSVIHIPIAAYLASTLVFAVVMIGWCIKLARDPKMPVDRTPDECWRLGSIYYNPNDPAVFVQKRIGFGYTFNFGNPVSWMGLGIFAVFMVVFVMVLR